MLSLGTKFAIFCFYFVTAAIGSSQVASFPSNSDLGGGLPIPCAIFSVGWSQPNQPKLFRETFFFSPVLEAREWTCQLPNKWESTEVRTFVEQSYQAMLASVTVKQPRNITGAGER